VGGKIGKKLKLTAVQSEVHVGEGKKAPSCVGKKSARLLYTGCGPSAVAKEGDQTRQKKGTTKRGRAISRPTGRREDRRSAEKKAPVREDAGRDGVHCGGTLAKWLLGPEGRGNFETGVEGKKKDRVARRPEKATPWFFLDKRLGPWGNGGTSPAWSDFRTVRAERPRSAFSALNLSKSPLRRVQRETA